MSEPFLGQIEAFSFGFAPKGWSVCAGQLLPINQNQALFSLLGTTFGGDGIRTFQLPNLQSRIAMGQGNGQGLTPRVVGEIGGEENHTLLSSETPAHNHALNAANVATTSNVDTPNSSVSLAQTTGRSSGGASFAVSLYAADQSPALPMVPTGLTGGSPHSNIMPYAAITYCIAMVGVFPTRN
jgi:microcystin-dependent protein